MKILRVHIDNFGVLSSYEKEFDGSFECILQDNGSGKTTLAAFICAMLYGMSSTRKTDRALKDRAHYAPWNGGRYGGSIEIEKDRTVYRIERTFDVSSQSGDTIKTYNLSEGMHREEPDREPGQMLLGMSKEAFLRTAFLAGSDQGSIDDLMPRLNKSINGTEETDTYQKALSRLDKAKKVLKADKGDKGRIWDLEKEIENISREKSRCKIAAQTVENLEKVIQKSEKERKHIEEALERIPLYEKELLIRSNLQDYETRLRRAESELQRFYDENGKKRAEEWVLQTCTEQLKALNLARATLTEKTLEKEDEEAFAQLHDLFSKQPLTTEDIDAAGESITEITNDLKTIDECAGFSCGEGYKELEQRFHGSVPTEEETEQLRYLCADYENAEKQRKERLSRIISEKSALPIPGTVTIITTVVSIFLLIFGAVLMVSQLPFGVPALAAGVFCLCASLLLYLFRDQSKQTHLKTEEREKDAKFFALRKSLEEKLALYRYDAENIPKSIQMLFEDRKNYLKMRENIETNQKRKTAAEKRTHEGLAHMKEFFSRYFDIEDPDIGEYARCLKSLRNEYLRYTQLLTLMENEASKKKSAKEALDVSLNTLRKLLAPFGYIFEINDAEKALSLETERIENERYLKNEVLKRQEELEKYRAQNPSRMQLPEEIPDEKAKEKLDLRKRSLDAAIAADRKRLESESRTAEQLEEYDAKLTVLKEQKSDAQKRYAILCRTKEFIERAEGRLVNRYTEPIRSRYTFYAEQVDGELCRDIHILPEDLSLRFERGGEIRKGENFSSGFCALSDIFLRLAVLEAAYPDNLPFLILDDPFTCLDDRNAKKTMEVLKNLSTKTQIIYLTCHSSRSLPPHEDSFPN